MKIGIDIDDTIVDTNGELIKEALKYDKLIGGKGFKDKTAFDFVEMFFWNLQDKKNFFHYLKDNKLLDDIEIKKDFKEINEELSKLCDIYFISSRNEKSFIDANKETTEWLQKNKIIYKEMYLDVQEKGLLCKKLGIDLFIDDNIKQVNNALSNGINAKLMVNDYNKNENLDKFENWYQIIEYIKNME